MRIGFLVFITACSKYSSRSAMGLSYYHLTGEYPAGVDGNLDILDILDIPDTELCKVNNGRTLLCNAIEKGEAGLLKKCLERIKSNHVEYPREKVISLIASYGGKVRGMEMPLFIRAVRLGRLEITKVLFETLQGYSLDACRQVFCLECLKFLGFGNLKCTIINLAIVSSNFELVKYLTNKYIEIETEKAKDPSFFSGWSKLKDLIVKQDRDDFALLDLALTMCRWKDSNSLKIFHHLLQDTDIFSHMASQYRSVLHAEIKCGNSEALKNMIDAIKEAVKTINYCQDKETIDKILNLSDAHNRTLLHCAVLHRRFDIVQYLMELGASATCFNKNKISPLFIAISGHDLQMVQCLLNLEYKYAGKASLQSSINDQDSLRLTALNFAVSCSSKLPVSTSQVLNRVLEYNPDLKLSLPIVLALLRAGANPYIPDKLGETPLHKAAKTGNADLVDLLLSAGVNPCIPDNSGETPLHKAAETGNADSVQLLLNAGANPLAEDVQRYTPLDVALKAILLKPPIEHDQTGRIKTLALILDEAIIQEQSSGRAVGKKRYESNVPNLFKQIYSIYKHGNHRCQRDLLNQILDSSLLQPYGISAEIISQCQGKKRPCDDSRGIYPSLNKKRKRKNVQECGLSSGSGRTIGTLLDIHRSVNATCSFNQ